MVFLVMSLLVIAVMKIAVMKAAYAGMHHPGLTTVSAIAATRYGSAGTLPQAVPVTSFRAVSTLGGEIA
ncbi:hypothetical protein ED236_07650 [Pseudomethylobacillus aquaticus]|uniref:Uncharacterized protein n=1 Tax=Pseudomethylobacillus aquaticus TaxID=2676064 RepID=A0A3N0V0L3_9PROT|nr:hypothetical protein ED236_07650 [Pseudomethylobacillus aquaticus]